ncbi:(Fe-S)-binding protein [Neiella marina]|uniref:(Fe-S)-binding protein n=1 Tax=Neiella holothuriorum TaxID=2870530 RepID=A0ABS7EGQ6_9GAMM|nr:(Fe-S)-binding protein [Neiella holothuriorum]MBW8191488.1 (Fe-S)-binding protein [Neiella holothuriorum]
MKKVLDWSNYHDQGLGDAYADIPKIGGDFAKAVSVCIRSGVCQEPNNRGLMCPSFRLSDDPNLSPGGRVQILKRLLNDSEDSLISNAALAESLEHCVSCKGCKRECENNLDMAAIKAEYLAQQRQRGMRSWRSWLFAEFPYLLYRYPVLATLIRLRNRSALLAKLVAKIFKVNGSIPLPEPAKKPYRDSEAQLARNKLFEEMDCRANSVVVLVDSFTALFNPQVAHDAVDVLTAAGYLVITVQPRIAGASRLIDSGRSLFSQGYIERAQQQAHGLVKVLQPYLSRDLKIVGLEPSALLMLRDEFLMMHLGEQAQLLAKQSLLFEEFLAREKHAGRFQLALRAAATKSHVLVHGHCHQKAVGAMKSMRKALRLIPELNFSFIEASCCGMAGSYGLEHEHAKQSLAMAEQGLLPALDAAPQSEVVCNGFSCSHQIFALRVRQPVHLASLLARHIKNRP